MDSSRVLHEKVGESLGKIKRIGSLISALSRYIDMSKAPKSVDVKKLFIDVLKDGTG